MEVSESSANADRFEFGSVEPQFESIRVTIFSCSIRRPLLIRKSGRSGWYVFHPTKIGYKMIVARTCEWKRIDPQPPSGSYNSSCKCCTK